MTDAQLPGVELVDQGLADLALGSLTVESLLVSIAAPRLRTLGFTLPEPFEHPELRLYQLLSTRYGAGAHSQYNSLVRRVVSFQRAAQCAR